MPLPPSFNARPFTMFTYLTAFGMPVYHGKQIWKGLNLGMLSPIEPETLPLLRSARRLMVSGSLSGGAGTPSTTSLASTARSQVPSSR